MLLRYTTILYPKTTEEEIQERYRNFFVYYIILQGTIIQNMLLVEEDGSDESDDLLGDPLLRGKHNAGLTVGDVMEQARQQALKGGSLEEKLNKILICCGCLGDRSDDTNEIVECDGCGVSVHEGITIGI